LRQTLRRRALHTAAIGLAATALALGPASIAAGAPVHTLVPIGSDYQPDTMQLLAAQAVAHDSSGHVVILVLPITYSKDAYASKNGERQQNLTLAGNRTQQMLDACNVVKRADQTCDAQLVPLLVRSDAYLASNTAFFTPDVDGMFVLGGDQTVAMEVVAGTPVEQAMADAFNAGAPLGGNSAGDAVQSINMINGYTLGNDVPTSMRQGAVDVWTYSGAGDDTRGLIFGLHNAITDQHVFEYGRLGRSLNVAVTTGLPIVGMDAATGAVIRDETLLSTVTGDTSGYLIDPVTYGSSSSFGGPNATLAARHVAFHLVAPGTTGYDLVTRKPMVGATEFAAPSIAGRTFAAVTTPSGAGALLLGGGLAGNPGGIAGQRFATLAGGTSGKIVILAAGYAKSTDAAADAKAIAQALQPGATATITAVVLDAKTDATATAKAISGATGIYLTAPDRSTVAAALAAQPTVLGAVKARWTSGKAVLLADNAAASVLGSTYIAAPISADVEASAPLDMLGVPVASGLGWYGGLNVEPRLLPDQNEPQLLRLGAAAPATIAVGVDEGTALEVSAGKATVRGDSAALVLDTRKGVWGTGTNGSLTLRWGILDSFVDGQALVP
jgi:cyanophycinase-like exopeptidase